MTNTLLFSFTISLCLPLSLWVEPPFQSPSTTKSVELFRLLDQLWSFLLFCWFAYFKICMVRASPFFWRKIPSR